MALVNFNFILYILFCFYISSLALCNIVQEIVYSAHINNGAVTRRRDL